MSDETLTNYERFHQFLLLKGLSKRTIREYMSYFEIVDGLEVSQELVNEFILNKRTCNGMARAFLKNYLFFLDRRDLYIPTRTGRRPQKIPKYIEKSEVDTLIEGTHKLRDKAMIAMMFYGGLRADETIKLRPIDINSETWDPTELRVKGKGRKQRIVLIPESGMNHVLRYMQAADLDYNDKRELFPITYDKLHDILTKLSARVLGKIVNPHQFRHTCASYLKEQGWGIDDIGDYLGHASIATTQMYAHIKPAKLKEKFKAAFA